MWYRWIVWMIAAIPVSGLGQDTLTSVEFVEPGRPEAWGMAYATAATLYHGLEVPDRTDPWDLRLAVEVSNIPSIDQEKTRIGFNGGKFEDLNKSPVFGRGRLWLGHVRGSVSRRTMPGNAVSFGRLFSPQLLAAGCPLPHFRARSRVCLRLTTQPRPRHPI